MYRSTSTQAQACLTRAHCLVVCTPCLLLLESHGRRRLDLASMRAVKYMRSVNLIIELITCLRA